MVCAINSGRISSGSRVLSWVNLGGISSEFRMLSGVNLGKFSSEFRVNLMFQLMENSKWVYGALLGQFTI